MLEIQEKEIDGVTYRYQPLMLKPSRTLFDKLLQRFGPAVGRAIQALDGVELSEDMGVHAALGQLPRSLGGFLTDMVKGLDPKLHSEVCDTLSKQMRVRMDPEDGAAGTWMDLDTQRETLLGNKIMTEFKLVAWALEVQYADFLEPIQVWGANVLALRAAASKFNSQKESTGSPTELQSTSESATP